ncbi:MAG: cytochrome c biogenesis protein ResB [Anaeromyxobacter sp.]|nr:cytochrome c biogenesis protein ResB [Anaeromyxobacter sp.]MBL0276389.1 cytochrome c biogenesis protein ResB [Anaeromyxobacter sp.]
MVLGAVLQIWVPPGPLTLVAATGIASLVVLGLSFVVPGRLRSTLAGFRFTSTLLIALAIFAVIGTLVLQGKPHELYRQRYGAFGPIIILLRFDDIFHGLPFAGLTALFGAAILSSASLRLPLSWKRAGFFIAHVGLLLSGAGAAASSVLSVRGRIDLMAGGDVATSVRVTRGGVPSGEVAPLGFELKLDQFDLVNYETEYRIGYYEKVRVVRDGVALEDFKLKTSFDPDLGKHRLPRGDSYRLKAVYPDFATTATVAPVATGGVPALQATLGGQTRWLLAGESLASPDGQVAVVFGWERPAPPPGALTAFLVSGAERKVWMYTADGELSLPLSEGQELAGGVVRLGQLLPSAARSEAFSTRSAEWKNPVAVLETNVGGHLQEHLVRALQPRGVFLGGQDAALVFEKRDKEVKAFLSHVTATQGTTMERAVISVNDPYTFGGWTLYQVNFNPDEPNYSGLEAVYDPGVSWVFLGFTLICVGVAYLFYVEPKLRGGGIVRPGAPGAGAAS